MPSIGPTELIVLAVLVLLVLGPARLPEAGRGLGRGIREFKQHLTPHTTPTGSVSPTSADSPETTR